MKKDIFELDFNKYLNQILIEYYEYLIKTNNFFSRKSFDYIYSIVEYLNIERSLLNKVVFNDNNLVNGIYLYDSKKICININKFQEFLKKEKLIIEYFLILFHELNHVLQRKRIIMCPDLNTSEIIRLSDTLRSSIDISFYNFLPDEIHSNLLSSTLIYQFLQENDNKYLHLMEKIILSYLVCDRIKNNKIIINSTFNYLYQSIFKKEYDETNLKLSDYETIVYGFEKSKTIIDELELSYKEQEITNKIKKIIIERKI